MTKTHKLSFVPTPSVFRTRRTSSVRDPGRTYSPPTVASSATPPDTPLKPPCRTPSSDPPTSLYLPPLPLLDGFFAPLSTAPSSVLLETVSSIDSGVQVGVVHLRSRCALSAAPLTDTSVDPRGRESRTLSHTCASWFTKNQDRTRRGVPVKAVTKEGNGNPTRPEDFRPDYKRPEDCFLPFKECGRTRSLVDPYPKLPEPNGLTRILVSESPQKILVARTVPV